MNNVELLNINDGKNIIEYYHRKEFFEYEDICQTVIHSLHCDRRSDGGGNVCLRGQLFLLCAQGGSGQR